MKAILDSSELVCFGRVSQPFLLSKLDAALFHLHGLNRDDTAYILDTFLICKTTDKDD